MQKNLIYLLHVVEYIYTHTHSHISKQGITRWTSGSPLSYQLYTNLNFGTNIESVFQCLKCDGRYGGYEFWYQLEWCYLHFEDHCVNLTVYKQKSRSTIYPYMSQVETCVLLVLTNLAQPEWIQVNCSEEMLSTVLCVKNNSAFYEEMITLNIVHLPVNVCSTYHVLKNGLCYLFVWHTSGKRHDKRAVCERPFIMKDITIFNFLFVAISPPFPPILSQTAVKMRYLHRLTYKKILKKVKTRQTASKHASGFEVCCSKKVQCVSSNMFLCENKSYISFTLVCNGIKDCPNDESDEELCKCGQNFTNIGELSVVKNCKYVSDSKRKRFCFPLYYMDHQGDCHQFAVRKEETVGQSKNLSFFRCNSSSKLDTLLLNDLAADCGPEGEDEKLLKSLLQYHAPVLCSKPFELACKEGHPRCYNVTSICTFQFDKYNHIFPCRDGSHLENCLEFECNMKFKCLNSYCIHWSNVCDAKWDCPEGKDESYSPICGKGFVCRLLFICRSTKCMCIHVGNVCDGRYDCHFGDDEFLCELKNIKCPKTCLCLGLAILCEGDETSFTGVYPYLSVFMHHMSKFDLSITIAKFSKATHLKLNNDSISSICSTQFPPNLVYLDLGFNEIVGVKKSCFKGPILLKKILLDDNNVTLINSQSFVGVNNLVFLSLSNNPLCNLPEDLFIPIPCLKIFCLKNSDIRDIDTNLFQGTNILAIDTTDYHVCCIASSHAKCTAERPWYIQCSNLLPNIIFRIIFMIISFFAWVISISSILLHTASRKTQKAFSNAVTFVNISDTCCALYLLVIWISDVVHDGKFMVNEAAWKSGGICFAAFGIFTFFNLSNQLSVLLLTLSRSMVVMHPLNTKFKRSKFILKCGALGFLISFSLTVVVIIVSKLLIKVLPTSLCLPFVDPSKSFVVIKVLAWILAVTQLSTVISTSVLHVLLVKNMKESWKTVQKTGEDLNSVIVQLTLISGGTILCWIPTNTIYISLMFISRYSTNVVFWTIAVVFPINSVVNPGIFIVIGIRKFVRQKQKQNLSCSSSKI